MSNAVQDRHTDRHTDGQMRSRSSEQAALTGLVERLTQQFSELSREEIERAVHGRYALFEGSRVRDFVPVLVERAARRDLGGAGAPRHRG